MELNFNQKYSIKLKEEKLKNNEFLMHYLYGPIAGIRAINLYFLLISDVIMQSKSFIFQPTIEKLSLITQLKLPVLTRQFKKLEALNLIKTYETSEGNLIFVIYPPLEAQEFNDNKIYNNVLISRIGKENYEKIMFMLLEDYSTKKELRDVSSTFDEVYKNELNNNDFVDGKNNNYNWHAIKRYLIAQKININIEDFKFQEITDEIFSLYSPNQEQYGEMIAKSYDFTNAYFDPNELLKTAKNLFKKEKHNTSETLDLDNNEILCEKMTISKPEKYVLELMNEENITKKDKILIDTLRQTHNLTDDVINCLLHYSFIKNNQRIVENYLYKIAKTINIMQIKTASDTMDYFNSLSKTPVYLKIKNKAINNVNIISKNNSQFNKGVAQDCQKIISNFDYDDFI
ncbi:DnaD domain protein [Spiroplasma endosymbiont of Labia minor]|uniref:DnaD domain protein n=1 Tax=Spiroplasma endosymbiont of Labia minor TaxID=3066305 RepID=UPI0030CD9DB5